MLKAFAAGFGLGALAGGYLARRSTVPVPERDRWARRLMNERIAPVLMERGIARGEHAGTGVIEHVGRVSGTLRHTLVHPVPLGDRFAVPLPYGPEAHWPKNVLSAGRARLEYRGKVYELANPCAMDGPEIDGLPRVEELIGRAIGGRWLVAEVASVREGDLETAEA